MSLSRSQAAGMPRTAGDGRTHSQRTLHPRAQDVFAGRLGRHVPEAPGCSPVRRKKDLNSGLEGSRLAREETERCEARAATCADSGGEVLVSPRGLCV